MFCQKFMITFGVNERVRDYINRPMIVYIYVPFYVCNAWTKYLSLPFKR